MVPSKINGATKLAGNTGWFLINYSLMVPSKITGATINLSLIHI